MQAKSEKWVTSETVEILHDIIEYIGEHLNDYIYVFELEEFYL